MTANIGGNIISGGPVGFSTARQTVKGVKILDHREDPTIESTYLAEGPDGTIISLPTTPVAEGQLWLHRDTLTTVRLFVAVNKDGTLTWCRAKIYAYAIHAMTGKKWDPLTSG